MKKHNASAKSTSFIAALASVDQKKELNLQPYEFESYNSRKYEL